LFVFAVRPAGVRAIGRRSIILASCVYRLASRAIILPAAPIDLLVEPSSWTAVPIDLLVEPSSWSAVPIDLLVDPSSFDLVGAFFLPRVARFGFSSSCATSLFSPPFDCEPSAAECSVTRSALTGFFRARGAYLGFFSDLADSISSSPDLEFCVEEVSPWFFHFEFGNFRKYEE
jgi:hypothetical protein